MSDEIKVVLESDSCVHCPYFSPVIGEITFGKIKIEKNIVLNYLTNKTIVCGNRGEKCKMLRTIHKSESLFLDPQRYVDEDGQVSISKLKKKLKNMKS